jgi:hypothetical protein
VGVGLGVVLGIQPSASCLLSEHCTTELQAQPKVISKKHYIINYFSLYKNLTLYSPQLEFISANFSP